MTGSFAKRIPVLESILNDPGESFRCFTHTYPYQVGWNYHPEHEIHLIRRSAGWVFVGDYVGAFEPGHLAFINSLTPHTWVSDAAGTEHIDDRDLVIQFSPELLAGAARAFPELGRMEASNDLLDRSWEFFGRTARTAAAVMEEINGATGIARLAGFLTLLDLLSSSSERRALIPEGYASNRGSEAKALVEEAVRFILASLPGEIRLNEVASHVRMSPTAFSRFFKQNTGQLFVDYVRKVRIARACWLLSETERPITEVCFEIGYNNISNFNRSFRTEREMTPREYRRLSRLSVLPINDRPSATRPPTKARSSGRT